MNIKEIIVRELFDCNGMSKSFHCPNLAILSTANGLEISNEEIPDHLGYFEKFLGEGYFEKRNMEIQKIGSKLFFRIQSENPMSDDDVETICNQMIDDLTIAEDSKPNDAIVEQDVDEVEQKETVVGPNDATVTETFKSVEQEKVEQEETVEPTAKPQAKAIELKKKKLPPSSPIQKKEPNDSKDKTVEVSENKDKVEKPKANKKKAKSEKVDKTSTSKKTRNEIDAHAAIDAFNKEEGDNEHKIKFLQQDVEFKLVSDNLKHALDTVKSGKGKSGVLSLDFVSFSSDGKHLTLRTSNNDIHIISKMDCDKVFEFIISHAFISNLTSSMENNIGFHIMNEKMYISNDGAEIEVEIHTHDNFPSLPELETKESIFEVNTHLRNILGEAAILTSSSTEDITSAVNFNITHEKIVISSTDLNAFTLQESKHKLDQTVPCGFNIDATSIKTVTSVFKNVNFAAQVFDKIIVFYTKDVQVFAFKKSVDDSKKQEFPKIKQFLFEEKYTLTIPKSKFLNSLNLLNKVSVSGRSTIVKLNILESSINISLVDETNGKSFVKIDNSVTSDNKSELAFYLHKLIQIVQMCNDTIFIAYDDESPTILFKKAETENIIGIVKQRTEL